MPHAYTEDQLVEQPAIGLFAELGWSTVSALEETFGRSRGDETHLSPTESQSLLTSSPTICLGRETKGEVVLVSRLRAALVRLNPALPPEAITAAVDELPRDRSAMSLDAANREVYLMPKEGIRVSVADTEPSPQPSPSGRGSGISTLHAGPLPSRGGEGVRSKGGGQKPERVRVIDWQHPANNDFLLVSQPRRLAWRIASAQPLRLTCTRDHT